MHRERPVPLTITNRPTMYDDVKNAQGPGNVVACTAGPGIGVLCAACSVVAVHAGMSTALSSMSIPSVFRIFARKRVGNEKSDPIALRFSDMLYVAGVNVGKASVAVDMWRQVSGAKGKCVQLQ